MTEAEQQEAVRQDTIVYALAFIKKSIDLVNELGLDAALWDLRNAKRRVEEAREKSNDA